MNSQSSNIGVVAVTCLLTSKTAKMLPSGGILFVPNRVTGSEAEIMILRHLRTRYSAGRRAASFAFRL
jgi:hypothetical protein